MRAVSPTGATIEGTLERLQAVALVDGWEQGLFEPEYEYVGQTDIDWDTQETIKVAGQIMFVDANGDRWSIDQIELIDD